MTLKEELIKKYTTKDILSSHYPYGFTTKIINEKFPRGINENIIKMLSLKRFEPSFLTDFRLRAFSIWSKLPFPSWSSLKIPLINYNKLKYYTVPKKTSYSDLKILKTFEKLGIYLNETNNISNVAVDAVFDSVSVRTTFQNKLFKLGIIFCPLSEAIKNYPNLVKKFLGRVVYLTDNYFASLNSAVFTEGSFCYIPKNTKCPIDLSTYFRINSKNTGQFERTLIIAEKGSKVRYIEGCTAPQRNHNQLHAAIVELIAFEKAEIDYITTQNWYSGNEKGNGGVYNFVTKRGICLGKKSSICWTQIEMGSAITWKYPSCVLIGSKSRGLFYSITLTNKFQQADTGTKMIHIGKKTTSKIISKAISCSKTTNVYRGLVKISSNAKLARNLSQCDSFLIGSESYSATYPYFEIKNSTALIEHEAHISKLTEEQLFYLQQRGFNIEEALNLIINGFCKQILIKLPLEFSVEAEKLLNLKLHEAL